LDEDGNKFGNQVEMNSTFESAILFGKLKIWERLDQAIPKIGWLTVAAMF